MVEIGAGKIILEKMGFVEHLIHHTILLENGDVGCGNGLPKRLRCEYLIIRTCGHAYLSWYHPLVVDGGEETGREVLDDLVFVGMMTEYHQVPAGPVHKIHEVANNRLHELVITGVHDYRDFITRRVMGQSVLALAGQRFHQYMFVERG